MSDDHKKSCCGRNRISTDLSYIFITWSNIEDIYRGCIFVTYRVESFWGIWGICKLLMMYQSIIIIIIWLTIIYYHYITRRVDGPRRRIQELSNRSHSIGLPLCPWLCEIDFRMCILYSTSLFYKIYNVRVGTPIFQEFHIDHFVVVVDQKNIF